MLSYGFAFVNDLERLREVIKRINRSPRVRRPCWQPLRH